MGAQPSPPLLAAALHARKTASNAGARHQGRWDGWGFAAPGPTPSLPIPGWCPLLPPQQGMHRVQCEFWVLSTCGRWQGAANGVKGRRGQGDCASASRPSSLQAVSPCKQLSMQQLAIPCGWLCRNQARTSTRPFSRPIPASGHPGQRTPLKLDDHGGGTHQLVTLAQWTNSRLWFAKRIQGSPETLEVGAHGGGGGCGGVRAGPTIRVRRVPARTRRRFTAAFLSMHRPASPAFAALPAG